MAGCEVEDDFSAPLGDPSEPMLSAALTYASTGSCPATAVASRDVNGPLSSKSTSFSAPDPLMEDPRMKAYFANRTFVDRTGISEFNNTNE